MTLARDEYIRRAAARYLERARGECPTCGHDTTLSEEQAKEFATATYDAVIDLGDPTDTPEDDADEDMSNWSD